MILDEEEDRIEFRFEEKEGDLFQCPEHFAFAHCVSEDLAMGKGIAKQFSTRYGGKDTLQEHAFRLLIRSTV